MSEIPTPPLAQPIEQKFLALVEQNAEQRNLNPSLVPDVFQGMLPGENEALPDPVAGIDLASAKGTDYITNVLKTHDYWKQRIDAVAQRMMQQGVDPEQVKLIPFLKTAAEQAVAQEVNARAESAEQGELDEIASTIRELVSNQALARLTHPTNRDYMTRRRFNEIQSEEQGKVYDRLGLNRQSKLYEKSLVSPHSVSMGDERVVEAQKAAQKVYTESMIANYVQGNTFPVERANKRGNSEKMNGRQDMPHELADQYVGLLLDQLDAFDDSINITADQYKNEFSQSGAWDPIAIRHERFTSYLFDGLQYDKNLQLGADIANILELRDPKDPREVAAFARGVATRSLVEGNDIETYIAALSQIPAERGILLNSAQELWESLPDDSSRKEVVAKMILMAHDEDIKGEDQAEWKKTLVDIIGGDQEVAKLRNEVVDQMMHSVRKQMEGVAMATGLEENRFNKPRTEYLVNGMMEGNAGNRREGAVKFSRQAIFAEIVSGMTDQHLVGAVRELKSGQGSMVDMADKVAQLRDALSHIDLVTINQSYGNTTAEINITQETRWSHGTYGDALPIYEIPPELQPLVIKANFVRELLTNRRNDWEVQTMMRGFFTHADRLNVRRSDLIQLHNEVVLSAVTASELIAQQFGTPEYPNQQLTVVDTLNGLGSAVTGARPEGYRSLKGFTILDEQGRKTEGYNTYTSINEMPDASVRQYVWERRNNDIANRARNAVEKPLVEAGRIARAKRLLADERILNQDGVFGQLVDMSTRQSKVFQQETGTAQNRTTGETIGREITAVQSDIQEMKDLSRAYTDYDTEINNWKTQYPPSNRGMLYRLGKGEAAQARQAVEKKINDLTGQKFNIDTQEAEALAAINEKINEQRGEKAQEIAKKLQEVAARVPSLGELAQKLLAASTEPQYDPSLSDQVIATLKIPVVAEGVQYNVRTQEVNTGEYDFKLDGYMPGQELSPLLLLAIARADALSQPVKQAIEQLTDGGGVSFTGEAQPIRDALRTIEDKLPNERESATVVATALREILAKAVGAQLGQIETDIMGTRRIDPSGDQDMQRAFLNQIDQLRRSFEQRRQSAQ